MPNNNQNPRVTPGNINNNESVWWDSFTKILDEQPLEDEPGYVIKHTVSGDYRRLIRRYDYKSFVIVEDDMNGFFSFKVGFPDMAWGWGDSLQEVKDVCDKELEKNREWILASYPHLTDNP